MKTDHRQPRAPRHGQRGIGTVVVVMLLFFVVSLAAAYMSRNMIFEQKTSANQARSTLAFEAAEAGVEWALAQLNGGMVNDNCTDLSATKSFQNRYVAIAGNGNLSAVTRGGSPTDPNWWPTCVHDGAGGWTCACPDGTAGSLSAPTGVAPPLPAFRVWPATPESVDTTTSPWGSWTPPGPGLMPVNVAGCTALPSSGEECLNFFARASLGQGVAWQRVWLALRSGLAVPPSAALTARTTVTPSVAGAAKLRVINTDTQSGGFTVNTAAAVPRANFDAQTIPGSPGSVSFADSDTRLAEVSTTSSAPGALSAGDRMFAAFFGMRRQTYANQPGLRRCQAPCSTSTVNALLANNPNRIVWVEGNLTVDADIGTSAAPALLIVDGDTLTLNGGVTIRGFVYVTGAGSVNSTIQLPTAATNIIGALVAEGGLSTNYTGTPGASDVLTITYDRPTMDKLRTSYGSWVRLPGGWADYKAVP